ncbi:MAG: hypothetical protein ABIG61_09605 [Planctomycetota bacterium]
MFYLCLAVSLAWLVCFIYLLVLDSQIRNIRRRIQAWRNIDKIQTDEKPLR